MVNHFNTDTMIIFQICDEIFIYISAYLTNPTSSILPPSKGKEEKKRKGSGNQRKLEE